MFQQGKLKRKLKKSGTLEGAIIDDPDFSVELLSWDLGYSGNPLSLGKEVLCMKFHVANKSSEQHEISEIFSIDVFVDGVEASSFVSDFYGEGTAYQTSYDTKMRTESETDIYICADCNVSKSHKVTVDLYSKVYDMEKYGEYYRDNIIKTFEFEIE